MSEMAEMTEYRQEVAKGDVLLREGDVDTRFFLLQKGMFILIPKTWTPLSKSPCQKTIHPLP